MKYMLGIDIGTQSIRTHIYDEQARLVAGVSTEQYVDIEKPSWASQKAGFWWNAICRDIKRAIEKAGVRPEEIVSVGCCGHMHGAVAVGRDGRVLMNDVQLYCDKRSAGIVRKMKETNAEECYDIVGNIPAPAWFGMKIRWIKDNLPEVYEKTYKFLTPKDYINFMLTGNAHTDPTEASGAYAMDWRTDEWSDIAIRCLGLDKEKLPSILKSFSLIGKVSTAAAQATGLSTKTKVICGCGDMLSSLYICGLNKPGICVDLTATASLVSCYAPRPLPDRRVMNLRSVMEGWVPYGELDASGAAFRWIRDTIAREEAAEARRLGMDEYDYLCGLAQKFPPGADKLLFMPYMLGERTMGSANTKGCYIGLHLGSEIGQMVRAMLEGVAFELKRTLDIFKENGCEIECVYHTAGGAKGALWNQIKADIYQLPVYTLRIDESSVLGAAVMGGVGAGIYGDPLEVQKTVFAVDREYLPRREFSGVYGELYAVFLELHDLLQEPFDKLAGPV